MELIQDPQPLTWSEIERVARSICSSTSLTTRTAEEDRVRLEREFQELVREHGGIITRLCYHYSTSRTPFEDLRQDCLINLWRGLGKYRGECGLATWVYRVVINTCITSFRSAGRQPEHIPLDSFEGRADEEEPVSENVERLRYFISRLPLLDRGIMMMWLDERTHDEIAEVTGLTKNNVAVKLHRIKERMKSMKYEV